MNKWIKTNWFKLAMLLIALLIVSGVFYWFQWRPSEIRKNCYNEVYSQTLNYAAFGKEAVEQQNKDLYFKYDTCLRKSGMD